MPTRQDAAYWTGEEGNKTFDEATFNAAMTNWRTTNQTALEKWDAYDRIQKLKDTQRTVKVNGNYFMINADTYFGLTDGIDEIKPNVSNNAYNDRAQNQPWKYSDGVTDNDGSALYTGLPVYVNITGTDVVNGSAEAVTYYVDEVGEYDNNNRPVKIKSDLAQTTAKQKMGAYVIDSNHKEVTATEFDTSATTGESVYRTDLNDDKGTVLQKVEFSNTLIVRPLIVEKDWMTNQGDKSVNENTHFDITAKIEIKQGSAYASLHENVHTETPTPDAEFTIPSSITDYSAKMSLPLYIKDGTFATYQATEILPSGKSEYPHKYNNAVTNHVYRTGDFTLNVDPVPTLFGHAPNVALENATKAEIINTLNVKQYKAEKFWDDDNNRDGVRPESIQFKLQRRTGTNVYKDVYETVIRYTGSFELTGNDATAIAGALNGKKLTNDGVASPITIDNTYTFTAKATLSNAAQGIYVSDT